MLLQQMLAFLIFIIIGYAMKKKNLVDAKGTATLSWLVANVANPALIVSGAINSEERLSSSRVWQILLIGILLYAVLCGLSFIVPYILRVPEKQRGTYRNLAIFSNVGFMGYPLLTSLKGSFAVLCASIVIIPFNTLVYTLCIWNFEAGSDKKTQFSFRQFLNVGIIACLAALLINVSGVRVDGVPKIVITNLANLTVSLSMITIGMILEGIDLMGLWKDIRLLGMTVYKMLVMPIVGIALFRLFIHDDTLLTVLAVVLATPTATITAMLSGEHGGDTELTTKAIAITTLISVITIPAIFAVMGLD